MVLMAANSKRVDPKGRNPLRGLLTMAQVAERKGVAHSAVARRIHAGHLPAWQFGDTYLIPEQELEEWEPVRGRGRKKRHNSPPNGV